MSETEREHMRSWVHRDEPLTAGLFGKVTGKFKEWLHPRGRDGRFIEAHSSVNISEFSDGTGRNFRAEVVDLKPEGIHVQYKDNFGHDIPSPGPEFPNLIPESDITKRVSQSSLSLGHLASDIPTRPVNLLDGPRDVGPGTVLLDKQGRPYIVNGFGDNGSVVITGPAGANMPTAPNKLAKNFQMSPNQNVSVSALNVKGATVKKEGILRNGDTGSMFHVQQLHPDGSATVFGPVRYDVTADKVDAHPSDNPHTYHIPSAELQNKDGSWSVVTSTEGLAQDPKNLMPGTYDITSMNVRGTTLKPDGVLRKKDGTIYHVRGLNPDGSVTAFGPVRYDQTAGKLDAVPSDNPTEFNIPSDRLQKKSGGWSVVTDVKDMQQPQNLMPAAAQTQTMNPSANASTGNLVTDAAGNEIMRVEGDRISGGQLYIPEYHNGQDPVAKFYPDGSMIGPKKSDPSSVSMQEIKSRWDAWAAQNSRPSLAEQGKVHIGSTYGGSDVGVGTQLWDVNPNSRQPTGYTITDIAPDGSATITSNTDGHQVIYPAGDWHLAENYRTSMPSWAQPEPTHPDRTAHIGDTNGGVDVREGDQLWERLPQPDGHNGYTVTYIGGNGAVTVKNNTNGLSTTYPADAPQLRDAFTLTEPDWATTTIPSGMAPARPHGRVKRMSLGGNRTSVQEGSIIKLSRPTNPNAVPSYYEVTYMHSDGGLTVRPVNYQDVGGVPYIGPLSIGGGTQHWDAGLLSEDAYPQAYQVVTPPTA